LSACIIVQEKQAVQNILMKLISSQDLYKT